VVRAHLPLLAQLAGGLVLWTGKLCLHPISIWPSLEEHQHRSFPPPTLESPVVIPGRSENVARRGRRRPDPFCRLLLGTWILSLFYVSFVRRLNRSEANFDFLFFLQGSDNSSLLFRRIDGSQGYVESPRNRRCCHPIFFFSRCAFKRKCSRKCVVVFSEPSRT